MTITLGDLSVRYVNQLKKAAEAAGADIGAELAQYKLDNDLLSEAQARISIPRFMRFGHDVMAAHQLPELGLLMGKSIEPSVMGLAGLTAACAATLDRTLETLIAFETLNSKNARGHSQFYEEGSFYIAEFYSVSPYNQYNFFIVDMALSIQCHLLQSLCDSTVKPAFIEIEFAEPEYAEHYERALGRSPKFRQKRNALGFRKADLHKHSRLANPVTFQECKQLCEAQLALMQQDQTFLDQVMNAISPLLNSPNLTLDEVASRLEMPAWTLQRRLKDENTSFTALLDETRKSLALIYLKDPRYSLGEIAYLLGFAYPNAFQRAFKRWMGIAPGEYRKNELN